ncbi:MAG TPA: hypothetical protein VFC44_04315 [Candidatus Saccharimonadales bacterium]|nr:hypothetical protein [Candidatus Saccharimonadales bacterium]
MPDASGKAALTRAQSKTCRFFGGGSAREASWSAECQFRFGPATGFTAIEEFCHTPYARNPPRKGLQKTRNRPTIIQRFFLENPTNSMNNL